MNERAGQQIYPKDSLPGQTPVQSIRLTPEGLPAERYLIAKREDTAGARRGGKGGLGPACTAWFGACASHGTALRLVPGSFSGAGSRCTTGVGLGASAAVELDKTCTGRADPHIHTGCAPVLTALSRTQGPARCAPWSADSTAASRAS
jgi:hypothetical protein